MLKKDMHYFIHLPGLELQAEIILGKFELVILESDNTKN